MSEQLSNEEILVSLRGYAREALTRSGVPLHPVQTLNQAADRIESLEAERDKYKEKWWGGVEYMTDMENQRDTANERIAELEWWVNRIDKTADGVGVMPGEMVFTIYGAVRVVCCWNSAGANCVAAEPDAYNFDPQCSINGCYSTREAAEAAKGGE